MVYRHSNLVVGVAKILEKENLVSKVKEAEIDGRKQVTIDLKYDGKIPAVTDVKLVSKPSIHRYVRKTNIKKSVPRHSLGILSTSKGVMSSREAQKAGVGGELICQIF